MRAGLRWTGISVLVVAAASVASADAKDDDLYALGNEINQAWWKADDGWRINGGGDFDKPARCQVLLDKLAAEGVPDSTTIKYMKETPDLKAGDHTLAELREPCKHIWRASLVGTWEHIATAAASEAPKLTAKGGYDIRYFENCVDEYNQMMKAGISPTERVHDDKVSDGKGGMMAWSGTIEELRKKWCDAGATKAKELRAAEEAPFRKALKADKLRLALQFWHSGWILAGGSTTSDPVKLAKADLWFVDLSRVDPGKPTCAGGKDVHTVRRHQFDATHALVKTTEKEYCGSPPSSAFR